MAKPPHSLRGERQQQSVTQSQQVSVHQQWSGPLPPPAALEKFNQIIPGGAERILAMAEKEQAHRIEYEKIGLPETVNESKRGQYLGAVISVAAVLGAVFTAYIGSHWVVSVCLVGVPVLGLVRAIVRPRKD